MIMDMPEHNQGTLGGTMLLGSRKFIFTKNCKLRSLYGEVDSASERHRHRYSHIVLLIIIYNTIYLLCVIV